MNIKDLFHLAKVLVREILKISSNSNEIISRIDSLESQVNGKLDHHKTRTMSELDNLKILAAQAFIQQIKSGAVNNLRDSELKVFSQFGDDGIVQYLIHHIDLDREIFVEFGVQNYRESNTRFLLVNNNWRGLVMDGDLANIEYIQKDNIYWRYDLTAIEAFVTVENINSLLSDCGFIGDIGILSIDIDGNDYWIWENIDVIRPNIVICEYNSVFGCDRAITIPYEPIFSRSRSHYSNLYWGCSLKALYLLAQKKGYTFVGCNRNGNNAYFVRNDKLGELQPLDLKQGYVESKFRESRDLEGKLSYVSGRDRLELIKTMRVWDLERSQLIQISQLL